jgi:hypothetical protein
MWAFRFTNSNAHAHPPESEVSGLVAGHTRPSFPPTYDIRQIDKIQPSCYVANVWSNWAAKHARLSLLICRNQTRIQSLRALVPLLIQYAFEGEESDTGLSAGVMACRSKIPSWMMTGAR